MRSSWPREETEESMVSLCSPPSSTQHDFSSLPEGGDYSVVLEYDRLLMMQDRLSPVAHMATFCCRFRGLQRRAEVNSPQEPGHPLWGGEGVMD